MWLTECLVSSLTEYDASGARLQVNRPHPLRQREELGEGRWARGPETNKSLGLHRHKSLGLHRLAGVSLGIPNGGGWDSCSPQRYLVEHTKFYFI